MSTATVPIQITCPDWCERTADEHVADLWNMDGTCIHHSADRQVVDTEGYQEALTAPRFHDPVELFITAQTRPDGVETASPTFHLNGDEMSVQQALALSEAIREVVYTYRVEGGVA